ncbi:MAG: barstar family protein [Candidatus Gracilibacteria bacterium]
MSLLNLSKIHTKSELMNMLGVFFGLPDWWGQNWDAFADCIRNKETSTLPSQIQIIGLENLQKTLGEDARIFREILDENIIQYILLPSSPKK